MKYVKLFPAALLCIVLVISGCKDKSELLARTWKLENLKYTREIPDDMKPYLQQQIEQLKQQFSITYKSDGTYISGIAGQEVKGTWKLNMNSTKITSTTDKGEMVDYEVIMLNSDKFNFKAIEGKEEVIFEMVAAN